MLTFILKAASRCNLNCTYCYVYNAGDTSWRHRPPFMSDDVFHATVKRIRRYCLHSGQKHVQINFHGGEPCLAGPDRFANWCDLLREGLEDIAEVEITIQTNGTLIDHRWTAVFKTHSVRVGVSIDGPRKIHDTSRVDHQGRGSYDRVVRGLKQLQESRIPVQVLSVVQPGADGLEVHRHFLSMGLNRINYLLPDLTHDTVRDIHQTYGRTPCADFLLPILNYWWQHDSIDVRVAVFWHVAELILGGWSNTDIFGNRPFGFVFVETDGSIEGLDVLGTCENGLGSTGLNVKSDDFVNISNSSSLHRAAMFEGVPLPHQCRACPESMTCAGGYLPHRYAKATGFNNPSVWCEDILSLFKRLRELLAVSVAETTERRRSLERIHSSAQQKPARSIVVGGARE
jgi:uncharacterized protein